jgi:hypothetical protein
MDSAPLVSLVITMMTLGAMMLTLLGLAFVGRIAGGTDGAAVAVEGSLILWLSTAGSAYVLSLVLSMATQRRVPAYEDPPLGADVSAEWGDLQGALGLAGAAPGLLADDYDRLWTLERLEAAEGLGFLSPFGFGALSTRICPSTHVEELYEVLADTLRFPNADQVGRAVSDAMEAVVEGRISEEELSPHLERLACEGTPEALASVAAAYTCRSTSADREHAQRILDGAVVRGQLSSLAFETRSAQLAGAHTMSAIADTLEGLRWDQPTGPTDLSAMGTTHDTRACGTAWFWSALKFAAALGPSLPATNGSFVSGEGRRTVEGGDRLTHCALPTLQSAPEPDASSVMA